MERIHKALEKARHQRKDNVNVGGRMRINKPGYAKKAPVQEIKYTQTQTITVSDEALKEKRIVAHLKDSPAADLFKILRAKVLQRMNANRWNVLAVSSPTAGAGKSLTAVNLAISLAMEANHSVLLVDLDFRRPCIHEYFGISPDKGLVDYFSDDVPLNELFIHPGIEKLVLLPAGHSIHRSSELLSTPKMLNLADELKNRYPDRMIIVDLPPLLQSDDAMVFFPNADACLLVVAEGINTTEEIERSLQLIDETKYLGSVLNKSDEIWSPSYY
jgi:capsular exopolysaccharide synthesis family protein